MATAKLKRMSVAQVAALSNISERRLYMNRQLARTGRSDLVADVTAGRISTLAALKIALPEKYGRKPSTLEDMIKLWSRSNVHDKVAITGWIISELRKSD